MSLFIAVISLSVGYASLSSSLLVSGEAHLRVKEEVRVTNLTIKEQISSSYDNNSEYYKNGLILRAVLPNKESKIMYMVELTNNSSVDYYLKSAGYKSIEEDVYTEIDKNTMTFIKGDFKYTIEGIKTEDTVIKPNKSTFTITITYKDGIQEVPLTNNNAVIDIRYEFDILDKIPPVVSFSPNGGCYGGAQVVRVTGYDEHFNHMDIEVYKNGQKIETKTINYPNNSYDISLNEYTEYTMYVKAYDDKGNVQTLSPQDNRGYTYQKYLIEEDSEYLYDKVKTCAVSDANVDFSKQPTNEEAKQAYYIDTKPIYYYRGPVTNNNVIFGGYCWKIVRTTETGGIKLLYSGKPTSDGKCTATGEEQIAFYSLFNESSYEIKHVGYMYGDDDNPYENKYDSIIKENIEAWYDGTLKTDEDGYTADNWNHQLGDLTKTYPGIKKYESFLEDTVWCNDRSGDENSTLGGGEIYYAASERLSNNNPIVTCPRSSDAFTVSSENGNGKLKYPVGLITADEVVMAGLISFFSGTNNSYLSSNSSGMYNYTMTPIENIFTFEAYQPMVGTFGTHYEINPPGMLDGVRPMVSLQNSVEIETTGNGTIGNPYVVITDGTTSGKKLYDTMISSAKEIVSDANVDFSKDPTNADANRLYYVDEGYPIYYYRGPVTNNNIIFGGYCWKIVRTTETGGIKLLYSGKPTSGQCLATGAEQFAFKSVFNSAYNNKKYVGYMYGEDDNPYENKYDSTIKKNIEAWFEGNTTSEMTKPSGITSLEFNDLTKYEESFLEDAVWCNDRTESSTSGNIIYYVGYDRNGKSPYSPSLACPSNDSFTVSSANGNGKLKHKVGLITADELNMGGLTYNTGSGNINTYLYTGVDIHLWWTLSPNDWSGTANVTRVGSYLNGYRVGNTQDDNRSALGIRPMVSLQHELKVTGSGTSEDPYQVPEPPLPTLYDKMISSATEIVSDENVDFSQQPTDEDATKLYQYSGETSGKGSNPIYYYRGPVTNNNVIFAGYCWKIVRTTETGGIKLIYSGTPTSDGKCTATGAEQIAFYSTFNEYATMEKYVGYMYGEDDNTYENKYDSTIKKNLDAWFDGTLKTDENSYATGDWNHQLGELTKTYPGIKEYESYLEDTVWCNDRSKDDTGIYMANKRLLNYESTSRVTPIVTCPSSSDAFTVDERNGNGNLKYPMGLITADEVVMAGLLEGYGLDYSNSYLSNNSRMMFNYTMTPHSFGLMVDWYESFVYIFSTAYSSNPVRILDGVRPMVSLKHDVFVKSGTGFADNPYVIN